MTAAVLTIPISLSVKKSWPIDDTNKPQGETDDKTSVRK